jgi:hypothetical protein
MLFTIISFSQNSNLYTWLKADQITENPNIKNVYLARHFKTKMYGLFSLEKKLDTLVPSEYHSIEFNKPGNGFVIVQKNGFFGVYVLENEEVKYGYESVDCKYNDFKIGDSLNSHSLKMKLGSIWKSINWISGEEHEENISFNQELAPRHQKALPNCDRYKEDLGNGDGLMQARDRKTKKWGMFQVMGSRADTLVPCLYDSLDMFGFNAPFTQVYNAGKVGIYTWNGKETVPCLFDGYKKVKVKTKSNITTYLLVKKGDKWAWIDWKSGELKSKFDMDSLDGLPSPPFEQK